MLLYTTCNKCYHDYTNYTSLYQIRPIYTYAYFLCIHILTTYYKCYYDYTSYTTLYQVRPIYTS